MADLDRWLFIQKFLRSNGRSEQALVSSFCNVYAFIWYIQLAIRIINENFTHWATWFALPAFPWTWPASHCSPHMISKCSIATNRLIMNAGKNIARGLSDKRFSLSDVEIRLVRPDEALKVRDFGEREMTRTFAHLYTTEDLSNYISEAYTEAKYLDWLQNKEYCVFGAFASNANNTGSDSENKEEINAVDDMVAYILAGPCGLPISEQEQSLCREKHGDIAPAEVKRLYAHPSTFGSGIAEKLLTVGVDWLKDGGKRADRSVYLGVYSENPRAIRFYEKNKFRVVGEYTFLVGEQKDREFIMKHNSDSH